MKINVLKNDNATFHNVASCDVYVDNVICNNDHEHVSTYGDTKIYACHDDSCTFELQCCDDNDDYKCFITLTHDDVSKIIEHACMHASCMFDNDDFITTCDLMHAMLNACKQLIHD